MSGILIFREEFLIKHFAVRTSSARCYEAEDCGAGAQRSQTL